MSRTSSRSEADLVDRLGLDRGSMYVDRLADVAQRVVDGVRQGVDDRRLGRRPPRPGSPPCSSGGRATSASSQLLLVPRDRRGRRGRDLDPQLPGDGLRPGDDLVRRHREAVVGHRAGDRRRALDRVEPVHPRRRRGLAPRGEARGRARRWPGPAAEEVGVERQDDVGLLEVVAGRDVLAEGEPGAGPGGVAPDGARTGATSPRGTRRASRGAAAPGSARSPSRSGSRSPVPFLGRCASSAATAVSEERVPGADLPPRCMTTCERSGS